MDIKIEVEFEPQELELGVVEKLDQDIREKLEAAGVSQVEVMLRKDHQGDIAMEFTGEDDQVAKAKKALGIE